MQIYCLLPALILALPLSTAAQEQSAIDRVIGARLLVSEFIRICVRTDADPDKIEDLALDETWIPDAPSTIMAGLNRLPSGDAKVYSFSRSRSTSVGRQRTQMQVIVPEPGVRDCTLEFELAEFADVRQALVSSAFTEEVDVIGPKDAPYRIERVKLCQAASYNRSGECAELAVDPASYPLTGQLTLVRAQPARPE